MGAFKHTSGAFFANEEVQFLSILGALHHPNIVAPFTFLFVAVLRHSGGQRHPDVQRHGVWIIYWNKMDRRNNANKRRSRITRFVHVWLGRFHSISAKFAEAFSNRGKNLVVGFTAKHEEHKYGFCGGGYIKLLPGDFDQGKAVVPSDFKGNIFVIFLVFATPEFYICCFYFLLYYYFFLMKTSPFVPCTTLFLWLAGKFGGDTPYSIMFGPDLCSYDVSRIHLIFTNADGKNLLKKDEVGVQFLRLFSCRFCYYVYYVYE